MAQFKITSKLEGLAPSEAADSAQRYRYKDKGPQIDAADYVPGSIPFDRRVLITPDRKLWSVGEGLTAFNDERTRSIVKSWEKKHAVYQRKANEGWKGDIRGAKADKNLALSPSNWKDGPEYDRMMFSLSKDEAERLGPEGVQRVFSDFVEAVRQSPYGGDRLIEVEPIHDDNGQVHIHVTAHRHGFDLESKMISRTIWQPEVHTKEAERLAQGIRDDIMFDYVQPNMGAGVSEDSRQAAAEAIREAGGTPTPELAGESAPAVKWDLPADPDAARVEAEMRQDEREISRLQEEIKEIAARRAAKEHALSVFRQRDELKATLDTTAAALAQATTDLAAEKEARAADVSDLSGKLEVEQARVQQVEEALETAQRVATERQATIDDLTGKLKDEQDARKEVHEALTAEEEAHKATGERLTDEVVAHEKTRQALTAEQEARAAADLKAEGLGTDLNAAQQRIGELENSNAALSKELDDLKASFSGLKASLAAEQTAHEATKVELKQEKDSFPQRVKAAVDEAVAKVRAEANDRMEAMQKRFDDAMGSLERAAAAAEAAKDRTIASLSERVDSLTQQVERLTQQARAAVAAPIQKVADVVRGAPQSEPHNYWYTVANPKNWTPDQRQAAERALKTEQAQNKKQGWTVEQYGEERHKVWKREQEKAAKPDETAPDSSNAPKPGRK